MKRAPTWLVVALVTAAYGMAVPAVVGAVTVQVFTVNQMGAVGGAIFAPGGVGTFLDGPHAGLSYEAAVGTGVLLDVFHDGAESRAVMRDPDGTLSTYTLSGGVLLSDGEEMMFGGGGPHDGNLIASAAILGVNHNGTDSGLLVLDPDGTTSQYSLGSGAFQTDYVTTTFTGGPHDGAAYADVLSDVVGTFHSGGFNGVVLRDPDGTLSVYSANLMVLARDFGWTSLTNYGVSGGTMALEEAFGQGLVVGYGHSLAAGGQRLYVLAPVPEPGCAVMAATGLVMVCLLRGRRLAVERARSGCGVTL